MIAFARELDYGNGMAVHDIITAALNDDNELVFKLLSGGVDVNTSDPIGFTPIHIACLHGNSALVNGLLEHSRLVQPIDFKLRTRDGLLPWQIAMDNHHYEIAQVVINASAASLARSGSRPSMR